MPHDPAPRVERTDRQIAERIVAEANGDLGTRFGLFRWLEGGTRDATWLLVGPEGERAVLKWSCNRNSLRLWLHVANVVAKVRAAGYPTPAWRAVAESETGFPYQIQDFVPGRPAGPVTPASAAVMIEALESQADIDPDPQRCWSNFVTARMNDIGLRERVAACAPAGGALLAACERMLAAHLPVTLPTGDLVHGDFRPSNVLIDEGRLSGVVDIGDLGSGSRVFDYATLYSCRDLEPDARRMVLAAGRRVAGPGAFAYSLAQVVLGVADLVLRRLMETDPGVLARLLDLVELCIANEDR